MSSPLATILAAKQRDIGDFVVGRVLPSIGRKMVGPFVFFDHMGPATFAPGKGMDVRPHPHIGLATLTFLFDGAIMHRDSVGSKQVIQPGDVNWMTAGSGIVHSERTPPEERANGHTLEGLQCWIALPREHEETAPSFFHHPVTTMPKFHEQGADCRLLVGDAFGKQSPVRTFSDTLYLDARFDGGGKLTVPAGKRELGVYVIRGSVTVSGESVPVRSLGVGRVGASLEIEATSDAHVMILGGEPLGEPREIYWNFVASTKTRIEKAKADWAGGRFATVPGDDVEFIPLP